MSDPSQTPEIAQDCGKRDHGLYGHVCPHRPSDEVALLADFAGWLADRDHRLGNNYAYSDETLATEFLTDRAIRPGQTTEEIQQEVAERAVAEVAGMSDAERQMHFAAGRAYGSEATCGTKIDYTNQASAERAATRMTAKGGKTLEAYPCWWCEGWHIGRAMTAEERERFARE